MSVEGPGVPPQTHHHRDEGPIVVLGLEDREVRLTVAAEGYRTLSLAPRQVAAMTEPVAEGLRPRWISTVWLAPQMPPSDLTPERLAERSIPGAAFVHGHVVDGETLRPVSGAGVCLQRAGIETRANQQGYFWLNAPGATTDVSLGTPPRRDDLVITADGYNLYRLRDIPLLATDTHSVIDMEKGDGETGRAEGHKLLNWHEPLPEPPGDWDERGTVEEEGADRERLVLEPVASIRVEDYGVMSLETYVGNGLNDEWIPSWSPDALRAGAIAYRSYGSWHQVNNGKICATTRCQVYDADSSLGSRRAAEATAGVLLERGGQVARAEYSAENNAVRCEDYGCSNGDLGCGDGAAGSPDAGWPCLGDDHGFGAGPGRCCFGHGRGMCQYGTQAWSARGWGWPRIVNHYYNDGGAGSLLRRAFLTSPLSISVKSATPSEVPAGGAFQVALEGRNLAESSHRHLLVQMRLTDDDGGGVANDDGHHRVELPGGQGAPLLLPFSVPAQTPPGSYGLAVDLWLDTDEDGMVGTSDLAMSEADAPGAVTVSEAPPQRLLRLTRPYMRGEDVRAVQEALTEQGYTLEVDGVYGPLTEEAVRAFQESSGLVVDGIVGPVTRAALGLSLS